MAPSEAASSSGSIRLKFRTWFIIHGVYPRCNAGRVVTLPSDVSRWRDVILAAWVDVADPRLPLGIALG